MQLKDTFDTIAKQYDKARLTYPRAMFAAIRKYQPLHKNDRLLEIGVGTGKATPPFARSGNRITAIDPGAKLLSVAKVNLKQYKNIHYINQSFEKAKLPLDTYALAYAAQAFHWVDPQKGLAKLHHVLTDDGALAFFWNLHDNKTGPGKDTYRLYRKYNMIGPRKYTHESAIKSVQRSRLYTNVQVKKFRWTLRMSKQQRLALVSSYSAAIALPPQKREAYIRDTMKSLEKYPSPLNIPVTTILVLARKK